MIETELSILFSGRILSVTLPFRVFAGAGDRPLLASRDRSIAEQWGEASPIGLSALMAAGLTLFLFTFVVNAIASIIVGRSRSGAGVEL